MSVAEPEPSVEAAQVVETARQKILGAFESVIQAMIEKAQEGSCPHAKFLVEFAGLQAQQAPPDPFANQPSLADILREELGADWDQDEEKSPPPSL